MHLKHPQQVTAGHGLVTSGGWTALTVVFINFTALLNVIYCNRSVVWLPEQEAWTEKAVFIFILPSLGLLISALSNNFCNTE